MKTIKVIIFTGSCFALALALILPPITSELMTSGIIGLLIGASATAIMWTIDRFDLLRSIDYRDADQFRMASDMAEWDQTHTAPLTRQLVRHILEHATEYHWTLQGFGLLRLYLEDVGRLHVWDSNYRFANVSEIHDHFWPLRSRVIAGSITNNRYSVVEKSTKPTHLCQRIVTGEGGGPSAEPYPVELVHETSHQYLPGDFYEQTPTDVHWTVPERGTVTLMARPKGAEGATETARVFYPIGEEWGTAEPRIATKEEVHDITQNALRRWF